jgi:predicted nucleotidyltransferase
MVKKTIIKIIQRYLGDLEIDGCNVRFGVLFGSQANGRADKWSDIDLVVVSPKFDKKRTFKDFFYLGRVALKSDYRIEPIPCGEIQWESDDASAIIEIARREGIRIDPAR